MSSQWVRVYTEITRDRKLRRYPASVRWAWVTILCMAKESPVAGVLLLSASVPITIEDIADEAAISVEEAEKAVDAFLAQDMLEMGTDGTFRLTNWDTRQFESDNSSERSRRHRNNKKGNTSEAEMQRCRNVAETPPDTDTDTDTETETETELINISSVSGSKRQQNEMAEQVIELLNTKAGTRFKPVNAHKKHIQARIREGYTMPDFMTVIDKKCAEWQGSEMQKYLRPETLFGSKFDGYLNQSPVKTVPKVPPAYQSIKDAVQRRQEYDLRRNGGNSVLDARSVP